MKKQCTRRVRIRRLLKSSSNLTRSLKNQQKTESREILRPSMQSYMLTKNMINLKLLYQVWKTSNGLKPTWSAQSQLSKCLAFRARTSPSWSIVRMKKLQRHTKCLKRGSFSMQKTKNLSLCMRMQQVMVLLESDSSFCLMNQVLILPYSTSKKSFASFLQQEKVNASCWHSMTWTDLMHLSTRY